VTLYVETGGATHILAPDVATFVKPSLQAKTMTINFGESLLTFALPSRGKDASASWKVSHWTNGSAWNSKPLNV
jgi:hypothetical protein